MDKDYIEQERDELRERLNDPQVHIDYLKRIVSSMDMHNPHRGHLLKTLNYLIAEQLK
jgi:hypothetical protein